MGGAAGESSGQEATGRAPRRAWFPRCWFPRWWWLSLALCGLVYANWLLRESATLYGDENAHLGMALGVKDAWASGDSWFGSFARAYEGENGRYPPLGHAAMLLATEAGSDALVSARFVSAVCVTGGVLAFSAAAVGATGRRRAGVLTTVLLLGSPLSVQAGRFAYLEGYLILWIGVLTLAFVSYLRRPSWSAWIFASVVTALGMLTKFSFVLYVAPMLATVALWDLWRWRCGRAWLPAVLSKFGVAGLIVGIAAGPWYVMTRDHPANAGSGLRNLIETGHLNRADSLREFVDIWRRLLGLTFAPLTVWVSLVIVACWAAWWARRRPRVSAGDLLVFSSLLAGIAMAFALPLLALGDYPRWNLQFYLVLLSVVVMLDSIAWRPVRPLRRGGDVPGEQARSVSVRLAGWVLGLLLMVGPLCGLLISNGLLGSRAVGAWASSRQLVFFGAPDARPSGTREMARIIDEARQEWGGAGREFRVAFMVHEHRWFHSETVEWELRRRGCEGVRIDRVGFLDRPIDLDWFLRADLVVTSSYEQLIRDPEAIRYQRIEDRLPELIGASFGVHRTVRTRLFEADVLRPGDWDLDGLRIERMLNAARESDGREPMRAYYDLSELVWSCRAGTGSGLDREEVVGSVRRLGARATPGVRRFIEIALDRLRACEAQRSGEEQGG